MHDAWFFGRFAPVYDRVMPSADRNAIAAGFERASGRVEIVLDLAGGSGRVARDLAATRSVAVVDLSRPMLVEAHRHGLDCLQADAAHLPYRSDSIDAAVIADAYHHFPDPTAVLGDVVRVLRPGGVLVVQDFDPTTVRGTFVELTERTFGWPAEFRTPTNLASDLDAAGLDATILTDGFEYTVAAVKPVLGES